MVLTTGAQGWIKVKALKYKKRLKELTPMR